MDPVNTHLQQLASEDPHARLLSVMPVVHELSLRGVRQQRVADALTAAGIPISAATLRKALSRWRKQQASTDSHASSSNSQRTAAIPAAPTQSLQPSPNPAARAPGTVTTKGDLVQLRRSADTIDLNHLAELGRQK